MRIAAIVVLILGAAVNQAQGADSIRYSTVGAWTIAVDTTLGSGCFAVTSYKGGAVFRLGFDLSDSSAPSSYFILGDAKWRSIEYGKHYVLRVRFGNRPGWRGTATGFSFKPPTNQPWLKMEVKAKSSADFLIEYMRQKYVAVEYNNKEILRLSLKDSYQAGLKLLECQKATRRERRDPFRSTSIPSNDPFK